MSDRRNVKRRRINDPPVAAEERVQTNDRGVVIGWRLDPSRSFSDWKIQVVSQDDAGNRFKTYHVHKFFLAAGQRKSDYFQGVFQASSLEEAKSGETHLVLERSAADAFPAFLDYIYTSNQANVTSLSAVALRHLAGYFGVSCLLKAVDEFIERDMSLENVQSYCKEAQHYHDCEIVESSMKVAAKARQEVIDFNNDMTESSMSPSQKVLKRLSMDQQSQVLKYALRGTMDELEETEEKSRRKDILLTAYRRRVRDSHFDRDAGETRRVRFQREAAQEALERIRREAQAESERESRERRRRMAHLLDADDDGDEARNRVVPILPGLI